ncbi:DUF3566 domain-containing protein [Kytococcus sp. Marseille-QA3725]
MSSSQSSAMTPEGRRPRGRSRMREGGSRSSRLDVRTLHEGSRDRELHRSTISSISLPSALKMSFLTGVGLGIAIVAGTALLWLALNVLGVFEDVNALIGELVGTQAEEGKGSDFTDMLGLGTVLTFTTVFAVVNTLVVTILGTVLALIYNLMAALVGGLRVDLVED